MPRAARVNPLTDPFIVAANRLLSDLARPQPKDPVARRRQAAELSEQSVRRLGIERAEVATEDHVIPVPGHPDARLRVYWPTAVRPEPGAGLPVLVYFFGGGWTIGGIDDVGWDATERRRAVASGAIIVAGEYSLAPEVRFPAQPEQCWSVLEWAHRHAVELGGDPERLAIGGASSGGNLAAAATLLNRQRADLPIRLQLLEAPAVDLTMKHADTRGLKIGVPDAILRRLGGMLVDQYLGKGNKRARLDPIASPLRAPSHAGLPEAIIYTAELDPLRGDGEAYFRALAAAGVKATCVRYIGQTHTSGGLIGHVPAADHLERDVVTALRSLAAAPARV
ncbi:alpha/beta hydrolase [Gryllotalpicola ginsengisoli]|uniref:alpha/beta hydrolase n=1 Tax=Gryllotalpicola ginsengisoli TaxID=444608 RepID=UPI0003B34AC2|nr:alpha/beta hydrolase [Gryllotalpicola ginsengisoli]